VEAVQKGIGLWKDFYPGVILPQQLLSIEYFTTLYGMSGFVIWNNIGGDFLLLNIHHYNIFRAQTLLHN
jgi:hypothetical protein